MKNKERIKSDVLRAVKARLTKETLKELGEVTADLEGYLSSLIESCPCEQTNGKVIWPLLSFSQEVGFKYQSGTLEDGQWRLGASLGRERGLSVGIEWKKIL